MLRVAEALAGEMAVSTPFREFLQQKAKTVQAESEARKPVIEEWRNAVDRLFMQIREWLKESDPDGLIGVEEGQKEILEPGLGDYRFPYLNLRAFGKWIGIIPKARRTVGTAKPPQQAAPTRAEGRVDMTDELQRYVLYRFRENGHDLWMIDGLDRSYDAAETPAMVRYVPLPNPKPLDQAAFEKALMSYLR